MKEDREALANKYPDCRVFIEFADANNDLFIKWIQQDLAGVVE